MRLPYTLAILGFALGIWLAQHYHQKKWSDFTRSTVQECTKGDRG